MRFNRSVYKPILTRFFCLFLLASWEPLQALAGDFDTTQWTYDPGTSFLTSKEYPDGSTVTFTYWYDKPKRITYASGKWKERQYNRIGQITANIYSSASTPSVYCTLNGFDTLTNVFDSAGIQYVYHCNPRQQVTNECVITPWMSWGVRHEFGSFGDPSSSALSVEGVPKHSVAYHYDNERRLSDLVCTNSQGRSFQLVYSNQNGQCCGYMIVTSGGDFFRREVFRDLHRPELITNCTHRFNGEVLNAWTFRYDLLKQMIQRKSWEGDVDAFGYNARGELAAAHVHSNFWQFGYDSIGNTRIQIQNESITNYYLYNSLNQCTGVVDAAANLQESRVFDSDGNLVTDGAFAYSWDCENRLVTVSSPVTGVMTNVFDYEHRRLMKGIAGERRFFVYNNWNIIFERVTNSTGGGFDIEYFWGTDLSGTLNGANGVGGLVAVSVEGTFYFPCYDNKANIMAYVSETGTVVARFIYHPFGTVTACSGTMPDAFNILFSTQYRDRQTGLYNFGHRFYDPALHCWLNRDPIGEDGGLNLYVYCGNDPVNGTDPNGCIPLDTVWDLANVVYDIAVGDDVSLAADMAALVVPYVPAGTTKLVRAAKLAKVNKICPAAKKLQVTYKYVHVEYHFVRDAKASRDYIKWTQGGRKSLWKPGTTDQQVQGYIEVAMRKAKEMGKVKPEQIKGVYDIGTPVGASNGKISTKIKLQVDSMGNVHAHPCD